MNDSVWDSCLTSTNCLCPNIRDDQTTELLFVEVVAFEWLSAVGVGVVGVRCPGVVVFLTGGVEGGSFLLFSKARCSS